MSKYINADELTEELEKQREFKDNEYCKGINAMLDTALMIIHNFTLGDEIAEKGEKQMPKYINADQFERDCMFDRECEDMQDVIYKLRDYPSADVVEVVRCKDCKYYKDSIHFAPDKMCYKYTDNRGHKIGYIKSDNDFCSYGERKE